MDALYFVYILTNTWHTVLYVGVTSDLKARVYQHREKLLPGFTSRYNVWKLVYFETGYDVAGAIVREKQIKAGSRQKKIDMIDAANSDWRDLYGEL
jgi:putative endonuclease